jgi:aminoglycoside phosphotransferase (APT) family kinase protein
MAGWLLDADPHERRALQDASVGVLAGLHGIDLTGVDVGFLELDHPGDTPLARHVAHQRWFYDWVRGEGRFPLIDAAFAWLDAHWPTETATVISWGDARIGNVLYDGFAPAAVLDWEMAGLGPGEIDVGWMVFLHRFFQDLTVEFGMPGLPDFMEPAAVCATYEARAGRELVDLDWYVAYAALRHAIIMARITARSVHFGEAAWPADPDEVIPHRAFLRAAIGG